jgi:hypothetical protein
VRYLVSSSSICDIVVIVLNVSIDVFFELADFQVVITLVIRVHLDPVVPVKLSDTHSHMGLSMSERTIHLRFGCIEIEVLQGSW